MKTEKDHRRDRLAEAADTIIVSMKDFERLLIERQKLAPQDVDRAKLTLRVLEEARTRVELALSANETIKDGDS